MKVRESDAAVMVEQKHRFLVRDQSSNYNGDSLRNNFNSSLFSFKT